MMIPERCKIYLSIFEIQDDDEIQFRLHRIIFNYKYVINIS
jgi:hypothetical protein